MVQMFIVTYILYIYGYKSQYIYTSIWLQIFVVELLISWFDNIHENWYIYDGAIGRNCLLFRST